MDAPQAKGASRSARGAAFIGRFSDALIVASAVSLAVIGIAAVSDSISAEEVGGVVFRLYGLALLFAAATHFIVRVTARYGRSSKSDIDRNKHKAVRL